MASLKRNKLLPIRGLMIISILLLSVLIGSWLSAQYKEQKQLLQKDLQDDLSAAKKEVSDSILYFQMIKPVMNITGIKSDLKKIDFPKFSGTASMKIMISDDDDTNQINKIKSRLAFKRQFEIDSIITNKKKPGKTTNEKLSYTFKDPQIAEEVFKQGLSIVIEELIHQTGISEDSIFQLDTTHLRKSFIKKLDDKDWHFTTAWNKDAYGHSFKKKAIFISINYLSKDYKVAVNNYSGYLLKKLLPQTLFSLILLLFVAAAFIISLRSLKEQIRLGVMKNDLISNMSHELKTPISTVKVALEALTTFNALQNPETTKEYLQMASMEMNRLDMLVNQALNASLLEAGKIVIQKECTDLKKTAEDIFQMLQLRLKQEEATLNIVTSGDDFTTMADPLHLQGVIINLIDNSLKYADKLPIIDIGIESTIDKVSISVSDNGPGIPAAHIAHIFDKFFRVPDGDRHNVKGYGLGLSYVLQIALQHKGTITAKNLPTGGCMFTLTLPKIPC